MLAAALTASVSAFAPTGSYPVDIRATRTVDGARLRLTVTDPAKHATVRRFAVAHGGPLHLFVVGGAGLRVFRHRQADPERDGAFVVDVPLPADGSYMTFADFTPLGGAPQLQQQLITIGLLVTRPPPPEDEAHVSAGLRARLDAAAVRAGTKSPLTFSIEDEASGGPAADFEPCLGAPAHLFIVSDDLTEGRHLYPSGGPAGPRLAFTPVFPRAGRYKLWLEVQRAGRVATFPFLVDVP